MPQPQRWTVQRTILHLLDEPVPGQEIFRVRDGKIVEVWHQEDVPGMLRQLGLEPPPAIMRLAARRSARRYRRQRHATR